MADVVLFDQRFDRDRIALFGHSRFGKTALLTAALDTRIRASSAISPAVSAPRHLPTVSASLRPACSGASPYWFPIETQKASTESSLDQQYLLAFIAPRPLLLGGASLDRWSDPAGAFQPAQSASAAMQLLGRPGLIQTSMQATNLDADIAYYFCSGGHGLRRSDFKTAIAFLNRQHASKHKAAAFLHLAD